MLNSAIRVATIAVLLGLSTSCLSPDSQNETMSELCKSETSHSEQLERISDELLLYRKLLELGVGADASRILTTLIDSNVEIGRDLSIILNNHLSSTYHNVSREKLPTPNVLLQQCLEENCTEETIRFLHISDGMSIEH